jgi:hypothetical protein
MPPVACDKCGKEFGQPWCLKRHQQRKTPCVVVDEHKNTTAKYSCIDCGRIFASSSARKRHRDYRCAIAAKNGKAAIDKLIAEKEQCIQELRTQISALELQPHPIDATHPAAPTTVVNNINVVALTQNTTNVTNVVVELRPWATRGQLCITAEMLKETFVANPTLRAYAQQEIAEMYDAEKAAPFVQEALQELVVRAQAADPASRNVHLNPARSDQVLVYDANCWRVRTLVEAIQAMFDDVALGIKKTMAAEAGRVALQLPAIPIYPKLHVAAGNVPLLYEQDRSRYIKSAKQQMTAHLSDMRGVIKEGHQPRQVTHPEAADTWLATHGQPVIFRRETPAERETRLATEAKKAEAKTEPVATEVKAEPPPTVTCAAPARPQPTPCPAPRPAQSAPRPVQPAQPALRPVQPAQPALRPVQPALRPVQPAQPARPAPRSAQPAPQPAPQPAHPTRPAQPMPRLAQPPPRPTPLQAPPLRQPPPWHPDTPSPRWTSCNAATALELDSPRAGESAKDRLTRLATEAGISTRHWANKLWDARDEGLILDSFQEAALVLIEADQAN